MNEENQANPGLFQRMLNIRAMSVICTLAEEAIAETPLDAFDMEACRKILAVNKLDEIYVICHERLALYHVEQMQVLRKFLAKNT